MHITDKGLVLYVLVVLLIIIGRLYYSRIQKYRELAKIKKDNKFTDLSERSKLLRDMQIGHLDD